MIRTLSILLALGVCSVLVVSLVYVVTRSFVAPQQAAQAPAPVSTGQADGCIVGGCSGELCTDEREGMAVSNCIYRAEFACYKTAKCERHTDGRCGWVQDAQLRRCLQDPSTAQ